MYVRVFLSDGGGEAEAEVLDVDDLTRLSVQLDGVELPSADRALRTQGLGELEDGHAWLVIERLRLSGADDAEWSARFAAMIRYAAKQNWLDDTATRVRAHVEP